MNKELEEVKEWIKDRLVYIARNCDINDLDNKKAYSNFETILNYIDNSISKKVVEEKINYYKGAVNNEDYEKLYNSSVVDTEIIIEFLQELLEGK